MTNCYPNQANRTIVTVYLTHKIKEGKSLWTK